MVKDVFLLQLQARILGPLSQTFKLGERLSDDQVEVWRATESKTQTSQVN